MVQLRLHLYEDLSIPVTIVIGTFFRGREPCLLPVSVLWSRTSIRSGISSSSIITDFSRLPALYSVSHSSCALHTFVSRRTYSEQIRAAGKRCKADEAESAVDCRSSAKGFLRDQRLRQLEAMHASFVTANIQQSRAICDRGIVMNRFQPGRTKTLISRPATPTTTIFTTGILQALRPSSSCGTRSYFQVHKGSTHSRV
jgi:hypothetical protein